MDFFGGRRICVATLRLAMCGICVQLTIVHSLHDTPWPSTSVQASAAPLQVTVAGQVDPYAVRVGQRQTFKAVVWSNANLGRVLVDFEVHNQLGLKVFEAVQTVLVRANQYLTVRQAYSPARGSFADVYQLKIGIFSTNWKRLYVWNDDAAPLQVRGRSRPHIITTGGAVPSFAYRGNTVKLTARISIKRADVSMFLVDMELYQGGVQIHKYVNPTAHVTRNRVTNVSTHWVVPPNARSGPYIMKIGIFGPHWSPLYTWNDRAATFVVG